VLVDLRRDRDFSRARKGYGSTYGAGVPRAAVHAARDALLTSLDAFVADAVHSDGIGSFVLNETAPLPWAVFARAMDTLMQLRGPDLLRVKGLVNVTGERGPVLVQGAQHVFHPPVTLEAWVGGDRRSRIVFITRGIAREAIEAAFAAVGALSAQSA